MDLVTLAVVGVDVVVLEEAVRLLLLLLLLLLLGEVESKGRNHFEQKLAIQRGIVLFPRSDVSPTILSPIIRPDIAGTKECRPSLKASCEPNK